MWHSYLRISHNFIPKWLDFLSNHTHHTPNQFYQHQSNSRGHNHLYYSDIYYLRDDNHSCIRYIFLNSNNHLGSLPRLSSRPYLNRDNNLWCKHYNCHHLDRSNIDRLLFSRNNLYCWLLNLHYCRLSTFQKLHTWNS